MLLKDDLKRPVQVLMERFCADSESPRTDADVAEKVRAASIIVRKF